MNWTDRAEKAANFLSETDHKLAELKVKHERDKRKAKRINSAIYLRMQGSIPERQALAETNPEYESAVAAEMTSLLEYEKLRNKRDTAETVIEFWRSWNRNQNQGQV